MRAHVLAFLNGKGGPGKTTATTNVAHGLTLRAYKVLICDTDPQQSAQDWSCANQSKLVPVIGCSRTTLPNIINEFRPVYDFIIIDGASKIGDLLAPSIMASDTILIPVQPSPYDIWATKDLVDSIKARQDLANGLPKAAFFFNRIIKNTNILEEMRKFLTEEASKWDIPVLTSYLTQRIAYPETAKNGLTVYSESGDVKKEIDSLIDEIHRKFL